MMGSALCVPLTDRGHDVRLIGTPLDGALVSAVASEQPHPTLGVVLPARLRCHPVSELTAACADADAIVLGVSSAGIAWAAGALAPVLARRQRPILMLSKGLEQQSLMPGGEPAARGLRVLTEALRLALPDELAAQTRPVAVCGPCIAGELVRRTPTMVVFTGDDLSVARRFGDWLETPYYRVVLQADVVGTQLCAALKNAYAMGIAFGAGLHQRANGERGSVAMHNYEAAVFAQSLVEMQELVLSQGGGAATALGLAGSGDLTVTCNGGRTGRFGALLGMGHATREAIRLMQGATLECLEVLAVLERFFRAPGAAQRPDRRRLPLLSHLIDVGLHGAPVDVPFQEFFRT
jgi:glycerol-3-phosphate dehydrogenase (NAD(P)+)